MIEEEVEENVSILNCCSCVLFFMKEKIDFSQPILMRNEKEKEKKTKTKTISRRRKREKERSFFNTHTSQRTTA